MYKYLLSIVLLIVNLAGWCRTATIQEVKFELFDDKFRLSIPNDPDIKYVTFSVNINKELETFESGELTGIASIPRNKKWSYEFHRTLQDDDIVYVWLEVLFNNIIFRDKKNPISVKAFKNGDRNFRLTTTTSKTITRTRMDDSTDSPPIKATDATQENKAGCIQTLSQVPIEFGGPYCRDDLIFDDSFDTLNSKYWANEIRLTFKSVNTEFVLYNGTVRVENSTLKIEAILNTKTSRNDTIDLGARRSVTITKNMYNKHLLSIVLIVNLVRWCCTFTIQQIEFELFDDKFRLSIPNDPDIKWVSFNVNINKEFNAFESGQLTGITSIPRDKKWSYEFDRTLKDNDIVYVWLAVQHNRLIFRDKKDPISVEAFKNGNPNFRLTTTTSQTITGTHIDGSTDSPPVKPIEITQKNKICRRTISEVSKGFGGPYCRDDLIFHDNFETLNTKYWINEIRIPPTTDDAEFVLYNGTLGVENSNLKIEASMNTKNIRKDTIDLGARCTSVHVKKECSLRPHGLWILPPIISGRISTKDSFSFKYGRIEVRAKMPIGDWLFPLISLQPKTPIYGGEYRSGEIRVAYIHGNHALEWQNNDIGGVCLFGGAIVNQFAEKRYQFMKNITLPNVKHFGKDFHLYSLTWTPNELIMTVDGHEYGRIDTDFRTLGETAWNKGASNAPFDQMFYITLGLAAGGNGDFPDTEGKNWNNTDPRGIWRFIDSTEYWLPSWEQPSLEVDYVRVYAV